MHTFDSFERLMAEPGELRLSVDSGCRAAEIFILDAHYNRIALAAGSSSAFALRPGVYSIKVTTGGDVRQQSIVLYEDQKVVFAPAAFTSVAPMEGSSTSHEYQGGNAEEHSRKVHCFIGSGSRIFIFVRDWTAASPNERSTLSSSPAAGLSLRSAGGEVVVDLQKSSPFSLEGDPWAACNVELDPGNYQLCLQLGNGSCLKQTVVASAGWQTQVFLLQRNYGSAANPEQRADLSGASIFMARTEVGYAYRPGARGNPDYRLAELAKGALLNSRLRLSENIAGQLHQEGFVNPMLGICAAHLLLLKKKPGDEAAAIIGRLRSLLGESHPDVEALALTAGMDSECIFSMPPMLRQSWACSLDASVRQPAVVPADALAAAVANRLWGNGLWTIWRESGNDAAPDRILVDQLQRLGHLHLDDDNWSAGNKDGFSVAFADIANLVGALGVPRAKLEALMSSEIETGRR